MEGIMAKAVRSIVIAGDPISIREIANGMSKISHIERCVALPKRNLGIVTFRDSYHLRGVMGRCGQQPTWSEWIDRRNNGITCLAPPWRFFKTHFAHWRFCSDHGTRYQFDIVYEPLRNEPIKLVSALHQCSNLNEQIDVMFKSLMCREHDVLIPSIYMSSIQGLLNYLRLDSSINSYGSKVSGLSSNISADMDFRIDFGKPKPGLRRPLSLRWLAEESTSEKYLPRLRNALRQIDRTGAEMYLLPGQNPVIALNSDFFDVHIDILGPHYICDSQHLTKLLLRITQTKVCPELPILTIVIKYLFSHHDIKKKTAFRVNGFKILVLIIHFLQKQGLMPALNDVIHPTVILRTYQHARSDIGSLMINFFDYYSQFSDLELSQQSFTIDLLRGTIDTTERREMLIYCDEPFHPGFNIFRIVNDRSWTAIFQWCVFFRDQLRVEKSSNSDVRSWGIINTLKNDEELSVKEL